MYATTFTVMGHGDFPFDMLRYDMCFPKDTGDAHTLGDDRMKVVLTDNRRVTLITYHSHKQWEPTTARWNSFGWGVMDVQPARKIT